MSDLQARFERAQQEVNTLADRPDSGTLLRLYALYKQATQGDVTGEAPGPFDFARRAKFDAWSTVKGTPKESAMRQYVELVSALKSKS